MSKRPPIFDRFFDLVVCINLDHRTDRWAYMKEQFDREGMDVLRLPALPGASVPRHLHGSLQLKQGLEGNAFASLLSHAQAIHLGKAAGARSILIFEDDVTIFPGFMERTCTSFLPNVPDNWDMLYLGGKVLLDSAKVNTDVIRPSYMYWTLAYTVRERVYDKCLEALYSRNHWADQLLAGLHPQLNVYAPETPRHIKHETKKFRSDNKIRPEPRP